jgi:hypothetical protein
MKLLEGKFKEGDTIAVDLDGKRNELLFKPAEKEGKKTERVYMA